MTSVFVLMILVMFGLGSPGVAGLSPASLYEAGLMRHAPPPCRELSSGEQRARGLAPKGKAATYSLNGEYLCERQIFDYGDRDSYADFVLRQAGPKAAHTARQVALLSEQENVLKGRIWHVTVTDGLRALDGHLKDVYETALTAALGPGRVARGPCPPTADCAQLTVQTRLVTEADILFKLTASYVKNGERQTWSL